MRHARDADELFEIPGDELRAIVGDDPRPSLWVLLLGGLENNLDIGLPHRLAQIPVHDGAAEAIQHTAQVVKRPRDVDITHVDMPMLMRLRRLLEAGPFLRGLPVPLAQQSRPAQHAPYAGRTHRHDIGVQHHEGQPPVALQRVLQMERDDRLLLPLLQPKVPGNPTIVLVDATVAFSPIVELAAGHAQPFNESPGADLAGL